MFGFFCRHPHNGLAVEKEHTVEPIDADFEKVVYYLHCVRCGKMLRVGHVRLIHGVDAFLNRKERPNE